MCIEGVPSRGMHWPREKHFHSCLTPCSQESHRRMCILPQSYIWIGLHLIPLTRQILYGTLSPAWNSLLSCHLMNGTSHCQSWGKNHHPFEELFSSSQSEVGSSAWSDHFKVTSYYCPHGREHKLTLIFLFFDFLIFFYNATGIIPE